MNGRRLGPICAALIAYDGEHHGLVSDVYSLARHGEIATLMAKVFRDGAAAICEERGWTALDVADALVARGISERWIVGSGLGGVLDLVLDEP